MIHLKADGGVPIGMSLPLHPTITEQWKNGVLKRVTAEGSPWPGDAFDLSGLEELAATPETSEPPADPVTDGQPPQVPVPAADGAPAVTEPVRPAEGAPKQAWQDYASALGACTADEATGMTRADLIKLCTPPEADPLAAAG